MSYPAYPEYKDSGVEWLGEVPAHWDVTTGKRLFSNRKERALQDDKQLSATQKYGVVPQNLFMESEQQKVTLALSGISSFRHVEVGDFVISLRSFQGGIEISDHSGCVSPAYTVMKPANKVDGSYFKHLLKSYGFISILNVVSDGIRDGKTISYDQFSSVAFPVPPKEEQLLVATFLDQETARIDALVEQQQRLIELLKEKRQAVISHAVTKGLDPDVPMKDSGVEWLGEVPAHWDLKSLMHLTPPDRKIMYGIVLPGPDFDGGVPIIKGGDVKPGRLALDKLCRTDPKIEAKYERSRVAFGDIVYSIRGGIGDAEIVPEEVAGSNLTQDAARVSPRDGVCNVWLLYALKSSPVFSQLEAKATGATIRGINIMDLKRATLPVPPLQEQQQIAERLGFIIGKLDRLEKEAGAAITLMQEHRSALISAAVTGKIDVRGWQPPVGSTAFAEATQLEAL